MIFEYSELQPLGAIVGGLTIGCTVGGTTAYLVGFDVVDVIQMATLGGAIGEYAGIAELFHSKLNKKSST